MSVSLVLTGVVFDSLVRLDDTRSSLSRQTCPCLGRRKMKKCCEESYGDQFSKLEPSGYSVEEN